MASCTAAGDGGEVGPEVRKGGKGGGLLAARGLRTTELSSGRSSGRCMIILTAFFSSRIKLAPHRRVTSSGFSSARGGIFPRLFPLVSICGQGSFGDVS